MADDAGEVTGTEPIDYGNLFDAEEPADSGSEQTMEATPQADQSQKEPAQEAADQDFKNLYEQKLAEFKQVEEGTHPIVVKGINELLTNRDAQWQEWLKENGVVDWLREREASKQARPQQTPQPKQPPAQDDPLKAHLEPLQQKISEFEKWKQDQEAARQQAERQTRANAEKQQIDAAIADSLAKDLPEEIKPDFFARVLERAVRDANKGQLKPYKVYVEAELGWMGRAGQSPAQTPATPAHKPPVTMKGGVATSAKTAVERVAAREKELMSQLFTE